MLPVRRITRAEVERLDGKRYRFGTAACVGSGIARSSRHARSTEVADLQKSYGDVHAVNGISFTVGLEEKRASGVKTLSGGQQRRLDVGLGIIGRPEVLFLDEPPPDSTRPLVARPGIWCTASEISARPFC